MASWRGIRMIVCLLALVEAKRALGQLFPFPSGPEFQVNTYTTGNQGGTQIFIGDDQPVVCSDSAGNFVVVWVSQNQNTPIGNGTNLFGQRYDSTGARVGTEFQVNSLYSSLPNQPAIACNPAGGFTVVWRDFNAGFAGQRFDSTGTALGTEFHYSGSRFIENKGLSMCLDTSNNFVVVYSSNDGSAEGVFGERFDSTGTVQGTEFQVNSYTTSYQYGQSVSCDSAGNFVVAWESGQFYGSGPDGDGSGIFAQRFDNTGTPQGTEFQVNTYTTFNQTGPRVSSDAAGNFVVVWGTPGFSNFRVLRGQRYDSSGAPQGSEFQVNSYLNSGVYGMRISHDGSGGFVVAWGGHSPADPVLNYSGVLGRAFDSTGAARGTDFQVNTYTTKEQWFPDVAARADGNLVITWRSECNNITCQDGSDIGVFGQRFLLGPPTHDSVVTPLNPLSVTIPKATTPPPKIVKFRVKVTNADPKTETPADTIQLSVDRGDCPLAMDIAAPNFSPKSLPPSDTVQLGGGKSATATVQLTIHSGDFATFNAKAPKRCTLGVTASTIVPTSTEPTPWNNAVPVEINVIDKNEAQSSTVHESVISSVKPLSLKIPKKKTAAAKVAKPLLINADYLATGEGTGHAIQLSVDPIVGCPWLAVAALDADPATIGAQDMVTVAGGKSVKASIQLDAADTVNTTNSKSPKRCIAVLRATTAVPSNVEPDTSNNATQLVIDVIDQNDF